MYQFLFVSHFICLFYFQTFIDTLVWLKCFFLLPLLKKNFLQSNNFIINILCSVINPLKKQHFVAIWQRMRLNVKQNVYRYKLGVIDGTCMVTSAIQFISMTYLKKLFFANNDIKIRRSFQFRTKWSRTFFADTATIKLMKKYTFWKQYC